MSFWRPRSPLAVGSLLSLAIVGFIYVSRQNQERINVFREIELHGKAMQARVIGESKGHRISNFFVYEVEYDYQID